MLFANKFGSIRRPVGSPGLMRYEDIISKARKQHQRSHITCSSKLHDALVAKNLFAEALVEGSDIVSIVSPACEAMLESCCDEALELLQQNQSVALLFKGSLEVLEQWKFFQTLQGKENFYFLTEVYQLSPTFILAGDSMFWLKSKGTDAGEAHVSFGDHTLGKTLRTLFMNIVFNRADLAQTNL